MKLEQVQKLVVKDNLYVYKKRRKAIFISYRHFCYVIHDAASELTDYVFSRRSSSRYEEEIIIHFFMQQQENYRAFLT